MKSQDILLLLKLVSLERSQVQAAPMAPATHESSQRQDDWADWEIKGDQCPEPDPGRQPEEQGAQRYRVRALAAATGLSKSQVGPTLKRCEAAGLARYDRATGHPRANTRALLEFLVHGLRYVYPARPGALSRGIATGLGAPVLRGELMTAGEFVPVWPDARGRTRGLAVEPIYKTIPFAVRQDPHLYALLALADALRLGGARERRIAEDRLTALLRGEHEAA